MCTVTYLPKQGENFIFTSNRDEGVMRKPALVPKPYDWEGHQLIYPKDIAGGTWIGMSKSRTVCLLNGAFETHKRQLPYRQSRGIVVLEALKTSAKKTFFNYYDLNNIEPFTLIFIDWETELTLNELRWDGQQRYLRALDPKKTAIWSSAPLYNAAMQGKRIEWFKAWREEQATFEVKNIRQFHKTAGEGNPISNLITERGYLRTLSITTVQNTKNGPEMIYEDLRDNVVHSVQFQAITAKQ